MIEIGTVKEIWRYPVKGMAGEKLTQARVGARGVEGDRTWALRDVARAEIQSCKARPQLLACNARYGSAAPQAVEVCLPDGEILAGDDPAIHARLSALVGRESTLESLRPASDTDFFRRYKHADGSWLPDLVATFAREPGEPLPDFFHQPPPQLADFVAAPGSFFLVTPLHVLTTATLAHLRALRPGSDWDARRFRPNLFIETTAGLEGLVEQAWLGRQLLVGDATIGCVGTTPRCGAITRAQAELGADTGMLRTVVAAAEQNAGIYGESVVAGEVRVGDVVRLVP